MHKCLTQILAGKPVFLQNILRIFFILFCTTLEFIAMKLIFATKISFTFNEEIKQLNTYDKFLVYFDVTSLFTNILLEEFIYMEMIPLVNLLKHQIH